MPANCEQRWLETGDDGNPATVRPSSSEAQEVPRGGVALAVRAVQGLAHRERRGDRDRELALRAREGPLGQLFRPPPLDLPLLGRPRAIGVRVAWEALRESSSLEVQAHRDQCTCHANDADAPLSR
jgi:hypothetical protein